MALVVQQGELRTVHVRLDRSVWSSGSWLKPGRGLGRGAGQKIFISPRTKRGGAASVRSRPPRDGAWRGRWDPELYGSVLGVEDAPLPAGEAPGVRGNRRRSSSSAPAGSLGAGLTAGARTHAGTRSTQSPGRPGRRASFTNPDRDGLRLLLGASPHHSFSAAACFCDC
jgi:hypothetical protein